MTDDPRGAQSVEERLRELEHLLDEGLITAEEHDEHARRIRPEVVSGSSRAESMHGNAVELLDALIGKWSRWEENERFYLDELAPRIARSEDPEFVWMSDEEERVLVTRLRALMSEDEWRVLPELIGARRALTLHELESDRGRPERLAAQEEARQAEERHRRREAEWAVAQERARSVGAARIRREEAAERTRLQRTQRDEAVQKASQPRGTSDSEGTQASFHDVPAEQRPARSRRRRQRRRRPQPSAEASASRDSTGRPSSTAPQGASTAKKSGATGTRATLPGSESAAVETTVPTGEPTEGLRVPPDAVDGGSASPEAANREAGDQSEGSPEQHDERTEPDVSDEAPPPGKGGESDPDEDGPTSARLREPVSAASDGGGQQEESPQDPDEPPTRLEGEGGGMTEPPDADSMADRVAEDARANQPDRVRAVAVPDRGSVASDLASYSQRLESAGERSLGDAVYAYANRVDAVERGELPPSMSTAPTAIAPEMVGAALGRSRAEAWIEVFRNGLIFVPVLWTWLKLQAAVTAYPTGRLVTEQGTEQFFNFWVRDGGAGLLGGTLAQAAQQVGYVLILLIAVNVTLGIWRRRTAARGARIGRAFAATLARAEATAAASRSADPQAALEGFVFASNDLSANLRSVGELLEGSVTPFADSVSVAQQAFRQMSDAVTRQEGQLAEVVERLGRVAEIGDQLGALQRDFSSAQDAVARSAEALGGIRDSLDPSARDFAGAAATLEQLAEQLARMTEAMAGAIADLESGLDSSAGNLREAATSMNAVATRVLDDLDGRGDGR